MDNNNLSVLNDGSGTHLKQNGELSAIDVSLASPNIAIKSSWTVFNDSIGSDHYPVIIVYNEPQKIPEISRYNYKRADWTKFKEESKNTFANDLYNDDNSVYNNNILKALHDAAAASIPKPKKNCRLRQVPYWNKSCQDAVNKRKRAERQMKKSKDLQDCINYRRIKAETEKIIRVDNKINGKLTVII